MGGEVGAASEPGRGSVFWCTVWLERSMTLPVGNRRGGGFQTETLQVLAERVYADAHTLPDANDHSAEARCCHDLAALCAASNPAALNVLDLHAEVLQDRLGASFPVFARAVRAYQLPHAAQLMGTLGYGGGAAQLGAETGLDTPALAGATQPRLLLVDDTPVTLTILVNLLQGDHALQVAVSGRSALDVAAGPLPPDLILLDVSMPEMDGFETLSRLKADPGTSDIPVLLFSANPSIANHEKGIALGASDFLDKPISPPLLLARIRTQLALAQRARSTAADGARHPSGHHMPA
jgi:CheY-like chemotaxis protein